MDSVNKVTYDTKTPTRCVIEFQGFRNNFGRFIIKELVFYDATTHVVNYFVFKPPFPNKILNNKSYKTNNWLTSNFHYITWDEGFTEYKELNKIFQHYCKQYDEVYTSGDEKSKFIKRHTTCKVINIHLDHGFLPNNFHGLCIGINNPKHKSTNCALSRAFRVGTLINCGGGEEGYKLDMQPLTHHFISQPDTSNIFAQANTSNGFQGTTA